MIQVTIPKDMLDDAGHETLVGQRMIKSMKEAGIPVLGVFAIRGVESGTLILRNRPVGFDDTAHQYEWHADGEVMTPKPKNVWRGNLKNGCQVFKTGLHALEEDEL